MPCKSGGRPPLSSVAAMRELAAGGRLRGGGSGTVEAEWKQQRENPVVGTLQVLVRLLQQSPQEMAPATAGPSTPITRRPKNNPAKRRRPIPRFL